MGLTKLKILAVVIGLCIPFPTLESKKAEKGSIMIFAPHPDDDILGCGGTILHQMHKGHKVTIVYMTSGGAASWDSVNGKLETVRENEAKKGAAKLGVEDLIFLRERDGDLRAAPSTVSRVASLLHRYSPQAIYVPHKNDGHKDHRATYKIVIEAVKKEAERKPSIFCYEVWTPLERVTHTINIADVIEKKLEALSEHKSQLANLNFVEAIKGLNCYRGLMTRTGSYAECFLHITVT